MGIDGRAMDFVLGNSKNLVGRIVSQEDYDGVTRSEFQQQTHNQQNETDFHGGAQLVHGFVLLFEEFILNQFINVLISRKMVRKYKTIIERTYPGNTLYHRNILGAS
jgi:hypothetical protein